MNNLNPLMTVITVTLNADKFLEKTIKSVIEQEYENIEYIVIDGGSTDNTIDIIQRFSDCIDYWVSEADFGLYDAMNKGIKRIHGQFFLFLNAGDCLLPGVINQVVNNISNDTKLIYGNIYHMEYGQAYWGEFDSFRLCLRTIPHPATFYHSDLIQQTGLFDLKYSIASDYAYNIKSFGLLSLSNIKYLDFTISNFQGGGVSSFTQDTAFFHNKPVLIKKYLGNKAIEFYENGIRFLDLIQFLDNQNFIVWYQPEINQLSALTQKIQTTNEIRKTKNQLFLSIEMNDDSKYNADIVRNFKVIEDNEYWHVIFENNPNIINKITSYGVNKKKVVLFKPTIFSVHLSTFIEQENCNSVIIFGTGKASKSVIEFIFNQNRLCNKQHRIKLFFDNNPDNWLKTINSIPVFKPDIKHIDKNSYVLIASQWQIEIRRQLLLMGINNKRIISALY